MIEKLIVASCSVRFKIRSAARAKIGAIRADPLNENNYFQPAENNGPVDSATHQTELYDLFGQCMAPKPGAWGVHVPKNPFVPQTESTEFCG